jgi:hypothetical protein
MIRLLDEENGVLSLIDNERNCREIAPCPLYSTLQLKDTNCYAEPIALLSPIKICAILPFTIQ